MLFGTFAGFAVPGGHLINRRKSRETGAEWKRLRVAVASAPFECWSVPDGILLRLSAGIALYATLLWVHPILFGVNPLP